jgi:hypothetical protein
MLMDVVLAAIADGVANLRIRPYQLQNPGAMKALFGAQPPIRALPCPQKT